MIVRNYPSLNLWISDIFWKIIQAFDNTFPSVYVQNPRTILSWSEEISQWIQWHFKAPLTLQTPLFFNLTNPSLFFFLTSVLLQTLPYPPTVCCKFPSHASLTLHKFFSNFDQITSDTQQTLLSYSLTTPATCWILDSDWSKCAPNVLHQNNWWNLQHNIHSSFSCWSMLNLCFILTICILIAESKFPPWCVITVSFVPLFSNITNLLINSHGTDDDGNF